MDGGSGRRKETTTDGGRNGIDEKQIGIGAYDEGND